MSKYDEKRAINDIRLLALDMINEAGSGHPGIALGAAPILYTLFKNHLNFDLERKDWINRDRFVLSITRSRICTTLCHIILFDR